MYSDIFLKSVKIVWVGETSFNTYTFNFIIIEGVSARWYLTIFYIILRKMAFYEILVLIDIFQNKFSDK
jgi:hypothetical protein